MEEAMSTMYKYIICLHHIFIIYPLVAQMEEAMSITKKELSVGMMDDVSADRIPRSDCRTLKGLRDAAGYPMRRQDPPQRLPNPQIRGAAGYPMRRRYPPQRLPNPQIRGAAGYPMRRRDPSQRLPNPQIRGAVKMSI